MDDLETDVLDVLITQERQLIARYETRRTTADGIATAAATTAVTLAALIVTARGTTKIKAGIDPTIARIAVGLLALAFLSALGARLLGGFGLPDFSFRDVRTWWPTSRAKDYDDAVQELRRLGNERPDAVAVRQQVYKVCCARADHTKKHAERKELWAEVTSVVLLAGFVPCTWLLVSNLT